MLRKTIITSFKKVSQKVNEKMHNKLRELHHFEFMKMSLIKWTIFIKHFF